MSAREVMRRLRWMIKVKDCRHICLFCEYFEICNAEGSGEREEKSE